MKTIEITKELLTFPSFVSGLTSERQVAAYIEMVLSSSKFRLRKQNISNDRYNLIYTTGTPRLWLCGHMDTVEPKNKLQLIPVQSGDRLYGLGAVDMKGGIAAIISAVLQSKNIRNIGLLFYCDEEYQFAGMKAFLKDFEQNPELVIVTEPTNLMICNAHRGILELKAVITGKSGHASRPGEGINAIVGTVESVQDLSNMLGEKYSNSNIGTTTVTLSKIIGGTNVGLTGQGIVYAEGTNNIPDTAEIMLDIRPAVNSLRGEKVKQLLKKSVENKLCRMQEITLIQDFGSLFTDMAQLQKVESLISDVLGSALYLPPNDMGYGDGQLFFEKTNSPVVYFGPGPSNVSHSQREYLDIKTLEPCTEVFKKFIAAYGK